MIALIPGTELTITNSNFCFANRSKWLQRLDDRWWWPLKGLEIVKFSLFNQSLELTLSSRRTSTERHPIAKAIMRKTPANILTIDREATAQIRRSLNLLFAVGQCLIDACRIFDSHSHAGQLLLITVRVHRRFL